MTDQAIYVNQWGWVRFLRNLAAFPHTKHRDAKELQKARKAYWNSPNIRWISYSKGK